jgi:hypothetical protein
MDKNIIWGTTVEVTKDLVKKWANIIWTSTDNNFKEETGISYTINKHFTRQALEDIIKNFSQQ